MLTQLFICSDQLFLLITFSIKSQFIEKIHAELDLKISTVAINLADLQRSGEHQDQRGGVVEKPLCGITSRERTEITPAIVVVGAVDHIERVADPALTTECVFITEALRLQRTMEFKLTQVCNTLAVTLLSRAPFDAQVAEAIATDARPRRKHKVIGQGGGEPQLNVGIVDEQKRLLKTA